MRRIQSLRVSNDLRRVASRIGLGVLSIPLSVVAVWDERWGLGDTARWAFVVVLIAASVAVAVRCVRSLRAGIDDPWKKWEVASLALVLAIQAPRWASGDMAVSLQGLVFVWAALVAAFLETRALLASVALAGFVLVGTEAILGWQSGGALALRLALLGACGAVLRVAVWTRLSVAEIANRQRVERQLSSLRDDARAYRLSSAPAAPSDSEAAKDGDERLLHSSVEEIESALTSCLSVCRVALGARTVVAVWLSDLGNELVVRGISSLESSVLRGPFSSREGVFGAALEGDCPVELVGDSAARPLPYYGDQPLVGHVAVLPLKEGSRTVGLLVLDREAAERLDEEQRQVVEESGRLARRSIDNERTLLRLDRSKIEQGKLYRAVERLNEVRTEVAVIQAGVKSARDFTAFHFAAVTVVHPGEGHEICAVSGPHAEKLVGKTFRATDGLVAMVVENRQSLPFRGESDAGVQTVFSRDLPTPKLGSLLVVPLLLHEEVLGTLVLGSEVTGAFLGEVRLTLQVLARHMAVSLANARMVKRLEELATTDGLTRLLNKRALMEVAQEKLRSAQRFRKPLSMILCDLDHFKAVNDEHGHDIGDTVIAGFADVLRRTKRETDVVGRFGGEEFVLVCEQTDRNGAVLLAERIRAEMSATGFVLPQGRLTVTCSLGVATFPEAGSTWAALFKASDEALYESKKAGRNRATVWSSRSAQAGAAAQREEPVSKAGS